MLLQINSTDKTKRTVKLHHSFFKHDNGRKLTADEVSNKGKVTAMAICQHYESHKLHQ